MIISFKDKKTENIWNGIKSKGIPTDIQGIIRRKLRMIHAAININDLRIPPGNRLEALDGNRDGQHSIRVNDQYRICFIWKSSNAENVEFIDYHK